MQVCKGLLNHFMQLKMFLIVYFHMVKFRGGHNNIISDK